MLSRRNFMAAVAALPVVGRLVPKPGLPFSDRNMLAIMAKAKWRQKHRTTTPLGQVNEWTPEEPYGITYGLDENSKLT